MAQTSNSLLSLTKWMVARGNQWYLRTNSDTLSKFYNCPIIRCLNMTKTLYEYVTALYRWLRQALSKAKELAFQEGRHHKWIYDRKSGAIALKPGDNILVKMDVFQGQRKKLKNRSKCRMLTTPLIFLKISNIEIIGRNIRQKYLP